MNLSCKIQRNQAEAELETSSLWESKVLENDMFLLGEEKTSVGSRDHRGVGTVQHSGKTELPCSFEALEPPLEPSTWILGSKTGYQPPMLKLVVLLCRLSSRHPCK